MAIRRKSYPLPLYSLYIRLGCCGNAPTTSPTTSPPTFNPIAVPTEQPTTGRQNVGANTAFPSDTPNGQSVSSSPPTSPPPTPVPPSESCLVHENCRKEGLEGLCCPGTTGVWLGCCPRLYGPTDSPTTFASDVVVPTDVPTPFSPLSSTTLRPTFRGFIPLPSEAPSSAPAVTPTDIPTVSPGAIPNRQPVIAAVNRAPSGGQPSRSKTMTVVVVAACGLASWFL
jgi:hypothetical protein